ncbi:outer membrane lipoprotein chaperone LolA [Mycoavidus sp. B2-EB]|uniref:outer membrane lipoprotein chaperone LolA n=1 Tax=Mycoavidus sp. B2-EB TaxID=2651972 RepID=UPI0016294C4D|nr:outer membrane lipoprotein chaperone LolA [Mycoavidus sp. B2-EB]BBO59996.1 outer-membrane lipoprotein carrier protein [Mycoavidus sp. B2-EB]
MKLKTATLLNIKIGLFNRLTAVFIAINVLSPAHASEPMTATEQLNGFIAQVQTAKGRFVQQQIKTDPKSMKDMSDQGTWPREDCCKSSGFFLFERPGKFIWTYEEPSRQILQSDGAYFYVYDKELKQVIKRKLDGVLGVSPAAILFGSNDLSKNFKLRDIGKKTGLDWLELKPKAADTQFQRILIGFRGGNLEAMKLFDLFGNVTLLLFTDMKKNPSLPPDSFKFTAPQGVDVVQG